MQDVDVVIVGAGISGIGAAYHLKTSCPDHSFVVFEGRDRLGGTWDLFRYPGIRSDSDMYTLGFAFKPWKGKTISDGATILAYLEETVEEFDLAPYLRFQHRVLAANWSSEARRWLVDVRTDAGEVERVRCKFLFMCSGYYDYERGYTPDFADMDRYGGTLVHPQHWPEDLDYTGKRVVVIGSGATAMTLVPAMAGKAAKVTMLQRSPTYVLDLPGQDPFAATAQRCLPERAAHLLSRWSSVTRTMAFFHFSKAAPKASKRLLMAGVRRALGPDYDVDTHFNPRYGPWDQRLCVVPDGDLFDAINSGQAEVVTDHVERFTETGLKLRSGAELDADIVVTATGLRMLIGGNIDFRRDGEPIVLKEHMAYKAMMVSDIPNMAICFGYTNASWTLKADLTAEYVCRLLQHMRGGGYEVCVPRIRGNFGSEQPFIDLSSGYIARAVDQMPKQGSKAPWRLRENYALDLVALRYSRVDDGVMEFSR